MRKLQQKDIGVSLLGMLALIGVGVGIALSGGMATAQVPGDPGTGATTSPTTTPGTVGTTTPDTDGGIIPTAPGTTGADTATTSDATLQGQEPQGGVQTIPVPVPVTALPAPMVLDIDEDGSVLIRGTVTSVGSDSITINSWGGEWMIETNSSAQVIAGGPSSPVNTTGDVSQIQVGNFVGAIGAIALGQNYAINATLIRDWTSDPFLPADTGTDTGTTTGTSDTDTDVDTGAGALGTTGTGTSATGTQTDTQSTPSTGGTSTNGSATPLYTGVVESVGTGSITFTDDATGDTFTAVIDPATATIWDTDRNDMDISNIQPDDQIRINGTLEDENTIMVDVIRDISR